MQVVHTSRLLCLLRPEPSRSELFLAASTIERRRQRSCQAKLLRWAYLFRSATHR